MSVPTVTFPIAQDDIKARYKELSDHLKALQAETRLTQSLLKELPNWCSHPNTGGKYSCPSCGLSWSSGD